MAKESVTETLLQKQKHKEEDIEANKVTDGDGAVTLVLLLSTFTALCSTFSYGIAAGFTSPVQTGMMSGLNLSLAEFSFFGSVLTIGGLIGALLSGKLADLFGRRGGLLFSNILCFIGWITIAFSKDVWSLCTGRLFTGIAAGIVSYLAPVYIVEIAPTNIRGSLCAINTIMMSSGACFSFLVGSIISWEYLALASTVPCILELVSLIFTLESPRWLSRIGRIKESEATLQRLRGNKTDIFKEAAEIKKYMEDVQGTKEDGFFELFNRRYSRVIIVGIGLLVLQQLGGLSGYMFYMSYIFEKSGFSSKVGVMATSLIQSVMSVVSLLVIDKYGRRPLLMVTTVMMGMGSALTGLSFLFQGYDLFNNVSPGLAFTGVQVFLMSISIGMGGIPWVIISEMTPINIKGSAGTLCNLISWSSNWFVSYTFNFLFQWSSSGVFFIYAIISGLGLLFVARMVPETQGRSLEELQASLSRQSNHKEPSG
ncbi:PREDICTED: putative sugar transporter ERD6-like 13 [Tarenaya hassleriana]|uniref:putative sugar transporter ERD6-like 13 n=1 Tax=Tarenaya hassleriana TaxID=28532 RepID=UPI00053C5A4F|nr:PREDICTED: putative sugar transporter ERD6-like 13 [Tarenaya hassleriana]